MNGTGTVALAAFGVALLSYLLGSVNMAILISRFRRKDDIRRHGSGNAGMTNMLRTYGKSDAIWTFAGDFLKGTLAALLGRWIFVWLGVEWFDAGFIAGIFVMIGHIAPVFFGFRGGKGIATAFGTMLVLDWRVFLVILVSMVPMLFIIRIVSAISLTGAILYPVLIFALQAVEGCDLLTVVLPHTACALLIAGMAFYAHRDNIRRLVTGTEKTFAKKKPEPDAGEGGEAGARDGR